MKILNLYAGIGGNRKLWGDEHDITAVEIDREYAHEYRRRFPNDTIVTEDAHQYLLDHYKEFDFIWSSPPCPSHSRARFANTRLDRIYPDLGLYQEIIFLKHHKKNGLWVVENVKPYYDPLITGNQVGRHLFWSNFPIGYLEHTSTNVMKYWGGDKWGKAQRNAVDPEIGLHILNAAQGIHTKRNEKQLDFFND